MPVVPWKVTGSKAVIDAARQIAAEAGKVNRTYKETGTSARQLNSLTQKLWRDNQTPVQAYYRDVVKLTQAYETNRGVTRQLYQQELKNLKVKYLEVGNAAAQSQHKYQKVLRDNGALLRAQVISQREFIRRTRAAKSEIFGLAKATAEAAKESARLAAERAKVSDRNRGHQEAAKIRAIANATNEYNRRLSDRTRLEAEGARVTRALETPTQTLNRTILELGASMRSGAISEQQFIAASRQAKDEILGITRSANEAAAATAKLNAERSRIANRNAGQQEAARVRSISRATADYNQRQADRARIDSEAQRVIRSLESPQQTQNRLILELGKHLRAGAIDKKQFAAASREVKRELSGENELMRKGQQVKQGLLTVEQKHFRNLRETSRLRRASAIDVDQYNARVAQLRANLKGVGSASLVAFGKRGLGQLSGYIGAAAAVSAAISLIRSEIELTRAAGERAATALTSTAQARRELKLSVLGRTDIDKSSGLGVRDLVTMESDRIAREMGLRQAVVDKVVETAISASATPQRGIKFAEAGLKFTRDGEGTSAFVGGMTDIVNALSLAPGETPQAAQGNANLAIGFMTEVRQAARLESVAKVGENLPRVVNTYRDAGVDPQTAAALFTGFSIAAADKQGDVSRTAAMNLIPRMGKFFRKNKVKGLRPDQYDETSEQLELLMNNRTLGGSFIGSDQGRAFLDDLNVNGGFRAAGRSAVIGFFGQQDSEARRAFANNRRRLSNFDALRDSAEQGVSYLNSGNEFAADASNKAIGAAAERMRRRQTPVISEENLENARDLIIGVGGGSRTLNKLNEFISVGAQVTNEEMIGLLQSTLDKRMNPETGLDSVLGPDGLPIGGPRTIRIDEKDLPQSTQVAIEETKRVIEQLKDALSAKNSTTAPPTGRGE